MTRLNQTLDEGQSGNPKALRLADVRGAVRALISDGHGGISRKKASAMGKEMIPTMAASTIMRFASGETLQPSAWTIRMLTDQVGYVPILFPKGRKLPKGALKIE